MKPFPECLRKVVSALMQDLDAPRALTVQLLIEHGEWDQLVNLYTDPAHFDSAQRYYRAAVATELLRKCEDIPTSIDKTANTIEAFWQSEKDCCRTNLRFQKHLNNGPFESLQELRVHEFLMKVKVWIGKVLGPLPQDLDGRFGPGATFYDSGTKATVPHKMSSRPTITQNARCLLPYVWKTAWFRALCSELSGLSDPEVIRGDRFAMVRKDATKYRGITIGPSVNTFLQLAVGGKIRKRLHRVKIDLDLGQEIHRRVACAASKTGHDATLDLKSASDTVARRPVEFFLPPDWYALLATLRCPLTRLKSEYITKGAPTKGSYEKYKWVYLEKFSAMGNGFTFELETLLFLGLAVITAEELGIRATPGVDIYVYGDDMIVPVEIVAPLTVVLRYCGFTLNERKSFSVGPFRESCGGDYFDGVAVRPHQIKEYPNDPAAWISLANGIRRMATADNRCGFDVLDARNAWFCALDNIPADIRRLRGPVQLGDQLIHDIPEKWPSKWKGQIREFTLWSPVHNHIPLKRWSGSVQLAAALYGIPSSGPIPRGPVAGYRRKRFLLSVTDEGHLLSERERSERLYKRLRSLLNTKRVDGYPMEQHRRIDEVPRGFDALAEWLRGDPIPRI